MLLFQIFTIQLPLNLCVVCGVCVDVCVYVCVCVWCCMCMCMCVCVWCVYVCCVVCMWCVCVGVCVCVRAVERKVLSLCSVISAVPVPSKNSSEKRLFRHIGVLCGLHN